MIASILRNIGRVMIGDEGSISILVSKQSEYKPKQILVCNLNLEASSFDFSFEDYDITKLTKYLPGTTSGNSANNSPYVKLRSQKDYSVVKPKDLIKIKDITTMKHFDYKIGSEFVDWIKANEIEFLEQLYKYFTDKYCQDRSGKMVLIDKKITPASIVFKFYIDGEYRYPGEINEFMDILIANNQSSGIIEGLCHTCGKVKNVIPTKEIKTSIFETFTLDQPSLVLGHSDSGKLSKQFQICEECRLFIEKGKQIMDTQLSFRAYNKKIDKNTTLYVRHSILPTIFNENDLKAAIDRLTQHRRNYNDSIKKSLRKEMEELNNQLKLAETKRKRKIESKIKDYEKRLENDYGNRLDQREILKNMSEHKISYLDFYYYIEYGSSGEKKILLDTVYRDYKQISKIIENIKTVETKINAGMSYKFKFNFISLFDVFDPKVAMQIQESLFDAKTLSLTDLARNASKNCYHNFMNKIFSKTQGDQLYKHVKDPKSIGHQLRVFKFVTELHSMTGVL